MRTGTEYVVETVYEPGRMRKIGLRMWSVMFHQAIASRELTWRLFVRGWAATYRQSWLGYVWAVIPPLVTALVFAFLDRRRVIPVGATPIPYLAYALWGIAVWQLFSGCCNAAAQSLVEAGPMVPRINFPKESLVFASAGRPIFTFLVRLAIVGAVFAWQGVVPAWTAVAVPLVLLPLVLLAIGIGMVVSVIAVTGNDVLNALGLLLNFGMFATPAVYPPPTTWPFYLVNIVNPVSPFLIASHDLLARGYLTMPTAFAAACVFAVVVFAVSWRFFCLAMPKVAERS